jgi:hypothetical protein
MTDTGYKLTGGCYCGAVRYEITGKPVFKAQCHCRECQYFSGGGPNYFMLMPEDGLTWTRGTPQTFAHADLDRPVTRTFCGTCGTHITTHPQGQDTFVLKVGTLDDPSLFGAPRAAIYACDTPPFHLFPEDIPVFDKLPPQ